MAQLVVRNIDESVKAQLQRRAAGHGRSMEEEVREILREAVRKTNPELGLGSRFAAIFSEAGLSDGIPELRGLKMQAATFDDDHS